MSASKKKLPTHRPLSSATVRSRLSEVLDLAAGDKTRVVVARRGKPLAAVVSMQDLALLEGIEDRIDAAAAKRAIEQWERDGRRSTPLDKIVRDLGIKL